MLIDANVVILISLQADTEIVLANRNRSARVILQNVSIDRSCY